MSFVPVRDAGHLISSQTDENELSWEVCFGFCSVFTVFRLLVGRGKEALMRFIMVSFVLFVGATSGQDVQKKERAELNKEVHNFTVSLCRAYVALDEGKVAEAAAALNGLPPIQLGDKDVTLSTQEAWRIIRKEMKEPTAKQISFAKDIIFLTKEGEKLKDLSAVKDGAKPQPRTAADIEKAAEEAFNF